MLADNQEEGSGDETWEPSPEEDLITSIIPHVFLPPRLPTLVQKNLSTLELEMMQLVNKSISTVGDKFPQLKPLVKMLESLESLQLASKNPADFVKKFTEAITEIKVGESIAYHVRNQNAAVLFTNLDKKHIIVQTFQCSLPASMIMSNVHPLFITFPHSTDAVVHNEVLCSKTFASHLHELSTTSAESYTPKRRRPSFASSQITVADPFLVTDWIVGLLVPVTMTNNLGSQQFKNIKKKIRDEVVRVTNDEKYAPPCIPFRRSPMWTAIKIATHLKILQMFSVENEATAIYKVIMLHMLTTICHAYESNDHVIWSVMLAKLGKRTEKLRRMQIKKNSFVGQLKQFTMKFVDDTISNIDKRMNDMWKLECNNVTTIPPFEQHKVEYSSNLVHNIQKLDEHMLIHLPLNAANINPEELLENPPSDLRLSFEMKRFTTLESILSNNCDNQSEHQTRIWIHNAELLIKKLKASEVTSTQVVYEFFNKYLSISLKFYKSVQDPVGMSQVVLCTLKIVQILDKIATNKFRFFSNYASGIKQSAFDKLLLPFQEDMALLELLLEHFLNRDQQADYLDLFNSTEVKERDFQVIYASANQNMLKLKRKILADTEAAIKKKYDEVTYAIEACKSLQNDLQDLNCECKYKTKWCKKQEKYVKTKVSSCTKCDLESQLESMRYSVSRYERPLPPESDKQLAVVYELMIPTDLANLRDALAFLNYCLLDVVVTNPPIEVKWKNYFKNIFYSPKRKHEYYNLGSKVLSVQMKHRSNMDVLKTPKENFIVDNGMDCVYYHSCTGINESFKFKISNTSSPDREMYLPLQYALEGTNINQNSVIADAYNCHKDMSLTEFASFGFLRDGQRIQLRNLYAYIADSTLALGKEPVLQLIMQTLWELGDHEDNMRIRHFEFLKNDSLTEDFTKILNNIVDKNEANYGNVLILLSVVIITIRIVELNTTVIPQAMSLLRKCRRVLEKWVTRIDESQDGKVNQSLQLKLSICSAFTFNISPTIDQQLEEQDLIHWLHTITRLHQLVDQDQCLNVMGASPFVKSLVHASFNVALKMEHKILQDLPTLLKVFAVSQWSKANQCRSLPWKKLNLSESCYFSIYGERNGARLKHVLTFDYLQGIFLVDGFPQGVLPLQIRDYPLYKMYFHNTNPKVQRDTNGFQTVAPFHSNHYEFGVNSDIVKIKELHENFSFELLEPNLFEGVIAKSFIDNYTHWLHSSKKRVIFRRKPEENGDYNNSVEFTLVRSENGKSWRFENVLNNKFILSIKSHGFRIICKALKSLEHRSSINVVQDTAKNAVTVHLPKYGLNFNLVSDILQSVEYPNFEISQDQNLETLIGLQRSLLLHNKSAITKQKVIIPHGNIQVSRKDSNHQVTNIDISNLHYPPYFTYDFDPVLHRLKAQDSKEAWLYLAALHGATSSPLPDPFTGLTGTEMSVWILQSALVWSSSPYDINCIRILKTIRNFSPKRRYHGQCLNPTKRLRETSEVTVWPEGLNDMAAYDGYALIVKSLIDDSNSLASLNGGNQVELEELNVSEKLTVRAYRRNVTFYNQCVGIKPLYLPKGYQPNKRVIDNLKLRKNRDEYDVTNLERLSRSLLDINSQANGSLQPLLISTNSLKYRDRIKSLQEYTLSELLTYFDFRANWLDLYSHAISPRSQDKEERQAWNIFFAAMSYKGVDMSHLLNLHLILKYANVVNSHSSQNPFPPVPASYFPNPSNHVYSDDRLKSILKKYAEVYPDYFDWIRLNYSDKYLDYIDRKSKKYNHETYLIMKFTYEESKLKFEENCEKYIRTTVESLKLEDGSINGPLSPEKTRLIKQSRFFTSIEQVVEIINTEIELISRNKKFLQFVLNVEEKLKKVLKDCSLRHNGSQHKVVVKHRYKPMTLITLRITTGPYRTFKINPEELFKYSGTPDIHEVSIWSMPVYNDGVIGFSDWTNRCSQLETYISNVLTDSVEKRILATSGISPRVAPVVLLQYLQKNENPSKFTTFVGALAVLWTQLQRQNRIQALTQATDRTSVELELSREQNNEGYHNWTPKDFPEWLLLQLELDMMIRPIQVEVAKQMMEMPNGKNGVMQLNMGEGKTSVIIPMLCATLASCDSLVRVTVLKSIFATNFKVLSFTIGGLLNQRVYVFPCRRDMEINENVLATINNGFKTCVESRGVILTLPEHRLSFRLKIYDEINKGNVNLGLKMMATEDMLREYVRDLLDESDELLSVKYQLVYTVGAQIPIDGNDVRWKTCQILLEHVQTLARQLSINFGSSVIEFDLKNQQNHPEQFEHFRFLDENCKLNFYDQLGDKILMNEILSPVDKNAVKTFITYENPPMAIHKRVKEITKDSKSFLNKILLWAGYIGRGILHLALTKRWRVEYGVDPKGHRLMAVPFRAKDVAAEKTEFGHPDLAIVLTQLSYYYSGLSDHEMSQSFECLKSKNSPGMIYSSWVHKLNHEHVPPFLSSYQGINLNDSSQRTCIFNLLRKNKSVIDFYLSEKVFPKESKQFPGKMAMSAWDLCHERNRLPVSGFSGTNDSSALLPLAITQQDLEQLAKTNQQLEQTLLKSENCGHLGLQMGVTCEEILKKLTEDRIKVLIDAGALMLELDNEQVASLWLSVDPSLEATVYFDKQNEILVKTRAAVGTQSAKDTRLEISPFQNRLGVCGVYLDDQHTRATDLKFAAGTRACVTVGTRMKREKLMQACMRMRNLGNGHSVTFYLSNEVFDKVTFNSDAGLQTSDIIAWVRENTKDFNEDGLVYWAMAGKNYAQKLAAEQEFEESLKTPEAAKIIGAQVVDQEITLLDQLYGVFSKSELLFQLIPKLFEATKQKLVLDNNRIHLREEVAHLFDNICTSVVARCRDLVPNKRHVCSTLEEEQERELEKEKELEVEEERQVQRPPKAEHITPFLHPTVRAFLIDGIVNVAKDGIIKLSHVFSKASFSNESQPDGWGQSVYATHDFASVIKANNIVCTDLHLRPVEYVAVRVDSVSKTVQILFLSPFEVNRLIPFFREGSAAFTLHQFSMRRSEGQDILINNPALQVPSRGNKVDETDPALACLHVMSGTLYFDSHDEAMAYARFLGLIPKPWSDAQREAFENGMITQKGFLLPSFRNDPINLEQWGISPLSFQQDPVNLVSKILACRHPENANEVAHVIQLLHSRTLPFPP